MGKLRDSPEAESQITKPRINMNTVKQASSFTNAITRVSHKEVIALGVKGWVIVTATHPLLKSTRCFTKSEALTLGEENAIAISKQPYAIVI